jgi:hypothetical protein
MSKVIVDTNEFADLIIVFLYDKLLNPTEVVTENEKFDLLTSKLYGKGLRSMFMKYYLDLPADMRIRYKRLKKVFTGEAKNALIRINKAKEVEKEEEEEGKVLKGIKKAITKAAKTLAAGNELDDEELDLIVEKMFKEVDF